MEYTLTDEQSLMKRSVKEIASDYGDDYWREVREAQRFPEEIYDDLAEGGWLGTPFPEEYGGQDMGMLELVLIMEALSEEGAWEAGLQFVAGTVFGGLSVLAHGSAEQKETYLPPIIDGEDSWALGVTEPEAGLNTAQISTFADRQGDHFVINGQKHFISGLGNADYVLLLTRTSKPEEVESPREGLTMFIVDPDQDGFEYSEIPLDLYFPERTYQVHIDDLHVPEEQVLGSVGTGMIQIFDTLNAERITTGAGAWGAGLWALDKAIEYAKDRTVWSEPIGGHQAIQHPLADAYADMESARSVIRKAAYKYDQPDEDAGELSNIANLQAAKSAWRASEASMKTFGGMSASAELGVAAAWGFVRHSRTAPVTEEMILNFIGHHSLDLPRSY